MQYFYVCIALSLMEEGNGLHFSCVFGRIKESLRL